MGTIHLHPKDREKYRSPEEGIPFDLALVGVRQRAAFEREVQPYAKFLDDLGGVQDLDEQGNPIPVPVIDPETGKQLIVDGELQFKPKLKYNGDAYAMIAWLALWGIGIKVPWDKFDVTDTGLVIDLRDEAADEGKAEASTTDTASTTP